jgi:hypothetical protein
VSLEKYFYFWDTYGYQQMTIHQMNNFLSSPKDSVKDIFSSLGNEYNYLFTIPLLPLMYILGSTHSRSTYILSLSLIYLLPYLIVLGMTAQKLVDSQSKVAFIAAMAAGVFSNAIWLPTLRGFPDTGAALLLIIASYAYLSDRELKQWWQVFLIGACLAMAPLFRRHYAYGVTAFLVSISLFTLIEYFLYRKGNTPQVGKRLVRIWLRIGVILIVCLLILLTLGLPFLKLVLSSDYQTLYKAWVSPPSRVLMVYQAYYGWGILCLAIAGLVTGFFSRDADRMAVGFVIVYGLVSVLQWLAIVGQTSLQYSLYFTWILILGTSLGIWWLWTKLKNAWRILGLAVVGGYFALNMVFWITPQFFPAGEQIKSLFAQKSQPLFRPDYDVVVKMIFSLRTIIPQNAKLYVVDSSTIINYDLLQTAATEIFPDKQFNILLSPQVDSRDYYPIESFLQADYVIVSDPLQIHLNKIDQGVVSGVYDAFSMNWEASQAFKRLPDQFPLMSGVKTSVFERVHVTSVSEAVRLLSNLQEVVGPRPGTQPDWVLLDHLPQGSIHRTTDTYEVIADLSAGIDRNAVSFLYLGEMPNRATISGQVTHLPRTCPPVNLAISIVYKDGTVHAIGEKVIKPGKVRNLAYTFDSNAAPYLLLVVSRSGTRQAEDVCRLVIDKLKIDAKE